MITIDSVDPAPLARWWAARLGGEIVAENDGWFFMVKIPGWEQTLGFQKVEAVTAGKNKIHLDIASEEPIAEVAAFIREGATKVAVHEMPGFSWTVLADPDGNQFCIGAN